MKSAILQQASRLGTFAIASVAALNATALAQDASIEDRLAALEGQASGYVDNSYLFLIGGLIVMFMAAGFCCLEAGLVRSKNAAMQSMKNVALFSVAGLMFWLVGYNMAYPSATVLGGGLFGIPDFIWSPEESLETGYSASSDWFFQMVFVATAASIVSGTVAERVKLWPFLAFTAVLTAFIYPIVASWEWGGGYLDTVWGFSDFAGSTLVHSTGGWAALVGAIIIGPRAGKYFGNWQEHKPNARIKHSACGTGHIYSLVWLVWL